MSGSSIAIAIDVFLIFGSLFAFWKGGAAERLAATVVLADVLVGHSIVLVAPGAEQVVRLVTDGFAALALLLVTIRYAAPWMGGVMLFFAGLFAMHSFYMVMERPNDYLHALINNINWSGVAWCLIIGTVVAWRQRTARLSVPAG